MTVTSGFSSKLKLRGTLLVSLSGILYGVLGYFGTLVLQAQFSVTAMLFWRFFIAALWMLGGFIFVKNKVLLKLPSSYAFFKLISLGIVTYCGSSFFYFIASQYIGTGVAMVIFFSYPVFVALFAWLFDQWQMNKHAMFSLFAVVIGVFFLKGQGGNDFNLIGILLAVIASLFYAIYVYGSKYSQKIDSRAQTFFICMGNAIIFFLISYINHTFMVPSSLNAWCYILALAVIATALPIQLMLDGLKYISPMKASVLSVFEPVVTMLIGLILLNETLSHEQMVGIIIVLSGALVIQFEKPSSSITTSLQENM